MKVRRHHNNKGTRKIRRGKTSDEVQRIARRLKVPFAPKRDLNQQKGPIDGT